MIEKMRCLSCGAYLTIMKTDNNVITWCTMIDDEGYTCAGSLVSEARYKELQDMDIIP